MINLLKILLIIHLIEAECPFKEKVNIIELPKYTPIFNPWVPFFCAPLRRNWHLLALEVARPCAPRRGLRDVLDLPARRHASGGLRGPQLRIVGSRSCGRLGCHVLVPIPGPCLVQCWCEQCASAGRPRFRRVARQAAFHADRSSPPRSTFCNGVARSGAFQVAPRAVAVARRLAHLHCGLDLPAFARTTPQK